MTVMEWPSQSPDLNLIEHLWKELERCVSGIRAQNADQKFSQLQTEWAQIPQSVITNLPRRCQAVIDSRGFAD
uniref:Tc1-like transposase DDE domain-containing protein n=1 Tax=Caenorhabditis japonica TaxID=281687 RepID=A0A8R1E6R8_CAEJA